MKADIIKLQEEAVNSLLDLTYGTYKDTITFKAPTGSGKTYMMAMLMDKILAKESDVIFLVSSLSKGNLAGQNFEKFYDYTTNGKFNHLDPYLITTEMSEEQKLTIPTSHNVYILPRDLYKSKSKLMRGVMDRFIMSVKKSILNIDGKYIYLIKDECHIDTKNLDSLAKGNVDKVYNFSATPKLERGQIVDVEIKKDDAVKCNLIKKVEWIEKYTPVEDAIDFFINKKDEYREKVKVNPCMIIEISNKDKGEDEYLKIKKILNDKGLRWMYIVGDKSKCDTNDEIKNKKVSIDKWKNSAKSNSSLIDVIIFKLAISEGWDIPRACMLYQVRNTQSEQLDEQVIGRVRRNPRLLDFEYLDAKTQELAMTAWVWGIKPKEYETFDVKLKNETVVNRDVRIKTTHLKELNKKSGFDVDKIINSSKKSLTHENIFSLYKKYLRMNQTIQNECINYVKKPIDWWKFIENEDAITKEYNKCICDYKKSMEVTTDNGSEAVFSFPLASYYLDTDNRATIEGWVWQKLQDNTEFAFDSDAEKQWAELLQNLSAQTLPNDNTKRLIKSGNDLLIDYEFLWGKNYPANSKIKFEYYNDGRFFSYPDFVMVDSYDRIHIFEVKSTRTSSGFKINYDEYIEKIQCLKDCYRQASVLTNNIFYIPLLDNDNVWHIFRFMCGQEVELSKTDFVNSIKTK